MCREWGLLFLGACAATVATSAEERRPWSMGSVVEAHRLSCPEACGIFPDQGLNLSPLQWQADS